MQKLLNRTIPTHRLVVNKKSSNEVYKDFRRETSELKEAITDYLYNTGDWDDVFIKMVDVFNMFVQSNCINDLSNPEEIDYFNYRFGSLCKIQMKAVEDQIVREAQEEERALKKVACGSF